MGQCDIRGFFGPNRFLSNFWQSPVAFEGLIYPTVEHAFQAAKSLDQTVRMHIRDIPADKAGYAKRRGRSVHLRPGWDDLRIDVMTELVTRKFSDNPGLKSRLLATGDAYLEESNDWGDRFWGACRVVGSDCSDPTHGMQGTAMHVVATGREPGPGALQTTVWSDGWLTAGENNLGRILMEVRAKLAK